jgi:translation elongation factor EF-1alpha
VRGWGKVEWGAVRDRVDGEWEEKNKEKEVKEVKGDESAKKKRGRPSNVELARRAQEKEDLARGE